MGMENGANGVEVIVSGKLRAQRTKGMKFKDGFLISTGEPKKHYIDEAVRHVAMRQGKMGPKMTMPDNVIIHEPKQEVALVAPAEPSAGYVDDAGYAGEETAE